MFMSRKILVAFSLGLASLGLTPNPALADNLSAIYRKARDSDTQYAAARAVAAAGREKAAQAKALLYPNISVNGMYQRNAEFSSTYEGAHVYRSANLSVALVQPLYRPAAFEAMEQGLLQQQLAEQQLQLAEQDLLLRVAKGYFDILQSQDVVSTYGAQRDALEQQLAKARKSYEVGLAPITDVNEAQARRDLTNAQEISARNDLAIKRRTLERTIRAELPALSRLESRMPAELISQHDHAKLLERANLDSLQVAASSTSRDIAERELRKQSAAHRPTLDLVANYGETHNANFNSFGSNNARPRSAGIELKLPIYEGGGVVSREREAMQNLEKANQELEGARLQARLDAQQASMNMESGVAMQVALQLALTSSEVQLRSVQRGLEIGVRTRVDVLNAEQQLFSTRRDLSSARYQTLIALLQLKGAAGTLHEVDLDLVDRFLEK
jgi:outer membrane protein